MLVGAPESEPEHQMEALLKDVEVPVVNKFQSEAERAKQDEENAIQRPMPRITEADKIGDQRSLNRLLSRTLYLLVQSQDGKWTFPSDHLIGRESFQLVCDPHVFCTSRTNRSYRQLSVCWCSRVVST